MGSNITSSRRGPPARHLGALLLAWALISCREGDEAHLDASPPASNPFAAATPMLDAFDGDVVRVLPAGGYTYLEIATADATRWVAVMGDGPPVGSHARIEAVAIQRDFHSRRLGREFAELVFGRVVKDADRPHQPATGSPGTPS